MTNLSIILACLSMIESGDNDREVGDLGRSRGRYQISQKVWERHTTWPFRWAHTKKHSDDVATRIIYARTVVFIKDFHRDPTPFEIYVLWNAPAQIGHPSKVVTEKAKRFENLVRDMERKKSK